MAERSSGSRGRLLQSPEPIQISQAQQHHSWPTAAADGASELYLVTPDSNHNIVVYADADTAENDAMDDSLDVSMVMMGEQLTSNNYCLLPEVERSDCKNPVALTLWHNNNNSYYNQHNGTIQEDWHYLNRVDVINYEATPAPFAKRPPLPNLISRPQPIRPTVAVAAAPPPPPPLMFTTMVTTCSTSCSDQTHA